MSNSAEVRSLAQLQSLRERCAHCRTQTLRQIENLRLELQKLTRWLDDEATVYWQREMTLAERRWNECRDALARCQATVRADEQRACTEERKRLERATQRRELCEKKLRATREARLVWQKQVVKLNGRLQNAADIAETQLLMTVQQLDAVISTLESYARVRSSDMPASPPILAAAPDLSAPGARAPDVSPSDPSSPQGTSPQGTSPQGDS